MRKFFYSTLLLITLCSTEKSSGGETDLFNNFTKKVRDYAMDPKLLKQIGSFVGGTVAGPLGRIAGPQAMSLVTKGIGKGYEYGSSFGCNSLLKEKINDNQLDKKPCCYIKPYNALKYLFQEITKWCYC